jgi:pyruvate dehydrogenase E1 component beta subunit
MAHKTLIQAINEALHLEMKRDDRVMVLGEDVGINGGVFRATEGLYNEFGENRAVDTPLAESGIIGCAIGMAAYGLRPVPEIQFDGFMTPAFDQFINHAARLRWRSRGRFDCPMTIRVPYGGGIRALEHHSEAPETYYAHTPGFKVVLPSNPYDAKGLLLASIRDPDPVIYFEPKRLYRAFRQDVPDEDYEVPIGKAKVVTEGTDVTVISWGAMARVSEEAVKLANEEKGISAELIDLRTLWPLDIDTIIASVQKTGRAVICHEAPRTVGLGAEIISLINEKALLHLEAPVVRVTGFDTAMPLFRMENYYLPNANRVLQGILKATQF